MQILFSLGPQEHAISPSSSLMKQIQMQQQSQMQFQYSLDSEEQLRACSMQDLCTSYCFALCVLHILLLFLFFFTIYMLLCCVTFI